MAPEQLEGKEADGRTDIFAFGATVYEMATGKKAFEGKSQASLIAAIMGQDPRPMAELQPMTPPILDRVVRRCLDKAPDERWQTAHDVMKELKWVAEGGSVTDLLGATTATTNRTGRRVVLVGLACLVLGSVLSGLAFWSLGPPSEPTAPVSRFALMLPPDQQLIGSGRHQVALSPDGTHLVYVANNHLFLRAMDQLEPTSMSGTQGGRNPFFSPDGQWVGFEDVIEDRLKKVSISGGAPVTLCEVSDLFGASWGANDTIVFGQGSRGIFQVPSTGGTAEVLVDGDSEEVYHGPQILPGGKAVVFTFRRIGTGWNDSQIVVQSLETGERQILIQGGTDARYLPTGHLVYARVGTLLIVPFDLTRFEVTGVPIPVVEGVQQAASNRTGAAQFSVSESGSLVYVPGLFQTAQRTLVWVDRNGQEQPVADIKGAFETPRLSPDGKRLALIVRGEDNIDVWIYELVRGTLTRLTFEVGEDETAIWTPDGKRVVFAASRGNDRKLFWKPADGSAPEELLLETQYHSHVGSWSPDGKVLAFEEQYPETGYDIWTLSVEGERQPVPFLQTSFDEHWPSFSPDGQWIAYMSNESGRNEIYVQPYPGPGGKWQISTGGGTQPIWSPKGNELFYRNGDRMMVVSVQNQPTFNAGTQQLLFEGQYEEGIGGSRPNFDVIPDGQRFVMVKADQESAPAQINVVLNWFEELKRLVPTN
jgi:serine/threonine-protein kinase